MTVVAELRTALAELLRAPLARLLLVGALVLLLQVPGCMVGQLARERQHSRDAVVEEIARTWGARQDVYGPFLVVPYRIEAQDDKGRRYVQDSGHVVVLPEQLDVRAEARVEARRRGLFDVPVYRTSVRLAGRFRAPRGDAEALVPPGSLNWQQAQIAVRLSDVHAIDRAGPLRWAGGEHAFQPGAGLSYASGVHAPLAVAPSAPAEFAMQIELRGSRGLYVAPLGRETAADVRANWPHPAFGGAWLPERREVGASGFVAAWHVTSLARGLPGAWKNDDVTAGALAATLFGVDLLQPVDPYRMSERSLKYNALFIGLTFVVIWLFEIVARRPVPLVQYLLLGAALCLFYLLELSLAEHLGFATAYALAASAVTVQVALYARAALRGTGAALALGGIVGGLYALLYLLLREEDYALLAGAGCLFAVLSAVMFLTRRVPWDSREAPARP